ncbi:methyltransferase-like protein 21B [Trypanosoma theileri]|uniref:Methyltransferase-like protein 21B n=1 Tax=Trypanosoma theileri TaxID=67003 RepID=A0A1X0NX63_9TRYP|nr:methyltransferase-like protein 21B [Trypanosoma theileri]ORC89296.1 methyltransferase-like protein 21B [Trypanosoma theileri]
MVLWISSAVNEEETHIWINNLTMLMLSDDRFTWLSLPGGAERVKYFVRRDSGNRDPLDSPYGILLESETLPQFEWPAASPFAKWIIENSSVFQNKKVLELGSGTGVVGLTAALYAAKVILTDSSLVSLAMLKLTVEQNSYENCRVGLLRWGSDDAVDELKEALSIESFDIIIGSDVFYFNSTLRAGLKTAKRALQSSVSSSGGFFLCASVARSERMEVDLDEVPATLGFESNIVVESGVFKLYKWTVQS